MEQKKKETTELNPVQRKRIIHWEISHLIKTIKLEYGIPSLHLITSDFLPVICKKECLFFNGKTGFPIFIGENPLGVLVCLNRLSSFKVQQIKKYIDVYLERIFLKFIRNEGGIYLSDQPADTGTLSFSDFVLSDTSDFSFLLDNGKKFDNNEKKENGKYSRQADNHNEEKSFFPLLLKQENKEEILKTAHELYLKTSSFAFLNTDDLKWKEGIFREMNGIFVCVPSFHQLSVLQKDILMQDISKKHLSCPLVVGVQKKENIPTKWRDLFHCAP